MDGCIFILSAIDWDTTRHVSFKFEWRLMERLNLTVEILLPRHAVETCRVGNE